MSTDLHQRAPIRRGALAAGASKRLRIGGADSATAR
jgi:hypothetical protein